MKTLYIDVLFFINFFMDFLSLFLVGGFMNTPRRLFRLVLSAGIGAVYAAVDVLFPGAPVVSFLIGLAVPFLLLFVAYGASGGWRFIRMTLFFYGISVLLGGAVTVLYGFLSSHFSMEGTAMGKSDILLTLGALSGLLIAGAERLFRRHGAGKEVRLMIENGGKTLCLSALSDSGNLLCDPIGGKPVILVRRGALHTLFPDDRPGDDMPHGGNTLFHPVFIHGADGRRMVFGFFPSGLYVCEGKKRIPITATVAAENREEKYGGCDALFPASLL